VVDGRNEYKILMGIPYPRRDLEDRDMRGENENKSSISDTKYRQTSFGTF
jgi:hypothetical protein